MAAEANGAVVRRVVDEIWNEGALEGADALFAPGYVNHGGLIPDLVRGPEAVKLSVALYRAAFPTLHLTIEELRAQEETLVLRWTARTAPPAAEAGSGPGGSAGMLTGSTRVRLVGGQIMESWTDWDQAGVLRRLGLSAPPEGG
jgi:hypothetical protein